MPDNGLLNTIYNTPRNILPSTLFNCKDSKICLLDFIGASDYFITESGLIWNRSKIYPNKKLGVLFKQYQPLVFRDNLIRVAWTQLNTMRGKIWFPVNQLVGWAFYPEDLSLGNKYFLHQNPKFPQHLRYDKMSWCSLPPVSIDASQSLYLQFVNELYK